MQKIILIIFIQTILFVLSNCSSSWKITKEICKNSNYSFIPPQRWMVYKEGTSTLLSYHGTTIDRILITRRSITAPLPYTQLTISPGILPHELGELLFFRAVATPGVSNVILREIKTTTIDGRSGIKCRFDYQINDITYSDIVYGLIDSLFLYELRFSATKCVYFDESVINFESVVSSFRLRK
jgi:hypothetical protein